VRDLMEERGACTVKINERGPCGNIYPRELAYAHSDGGQRYLWLMMTNILCMSGANADVWLIGGTCHQILATRYFTWICANKCSSFC
jgi:hypothetical protein